MMRDHPDSTVVMGVKVNALYRPEDLRQVWRWIPASLEEQVADTLVIRGPAWAIGYMPGLRFVDRVFLLERP
jgi:hypothetical protein